MTDAEKASQDHAETVEELRRRIEAFRHLERRPLWLRLLPSIVVTVGTALSILIFAPQYWWSSVAVVPVYYLTPAGQEIWIPLAHERFGLPYLLTAYLLLMANVATSLFVVLVLPVEKVLLRVPRIGRKILRFERRVRENRLARRSLTVALAAVVALPIHSGGSILGSVVGRLVGLTWLQTASAVTVAVTVRIAVALALVYGFMRMPAWG